MPGLPRPRARCFPPAGLPGRPYEIFEAHRGPQPPCPFHPRLLLPSARPWCYGKGVHPEGSRVWTRSSGDRNGRRRGDKGLCHGQEKTCSHAHSLTSYVAIRLAGCLVVCRYRAGHGSWKGGTATEPGTSKRLGRVSEPAGTRRRVQNTARALAYASMKQVWARRRPYILRTWLRFLSFPAAGRASLGSKEGRSVRLDGRTSWGAGWRDI
jgi:hypothetical protein